LIKKKEKILRIEDNGVIEKNVWEIMMENKFEQFKSGEELKIE
jgi:hypothetical protein